MKALIKKTPLKNIVTEPMIDIDNIHILYRNHLINQA